MKSTYRYSDRRFEAQLFCAACETSVSERERSAARFACREMQRIGKIQALLTVA